MRIRPGRERSLLTGILALVVMVAGFVMLSSGPFGSGPFGWFIILWVVFGLAIAGMSFYNALSERGLPLYEVDVDEESGDFCPQCGERVGADDKFCKNCGTPLQ